jgi:hypothetical protein
MAERDRYVSRRIYFYRLAEAQDILSVLPNDLSRIANLPFNEVGRYLKDGEGGRLCVWPDALEFPLKLRFGKTRLQNLPIKERAGKLEALDFEADAGLAELVHVVIFDDGYVAAEFNFEAPRLKRLGEYLYSKKNELQNKPVFLPLFQKDIFQLVQDMPTIKVLELKGTPDARYLLSEADKSLADAYGTMGELGANKTIELVLRAEEKSGSKLKRLSTRLAKLTQQLPADVRVSMSKLKVKGLSSEGKFDEVDLLEDHLISIKQFEKISEKDKGISQTSAYNQLISAYNEKKSEFQAATIGRMFI